MGNEFGQADFQPHLISAIVYERKFDTNQTAGTKTVIVAGGYHPKMRLRYGSMMVVDLEHGMDNTAGAFNVLHGSSEVVAAATLTDTDSIGVYDTLTIVDQYKDVAAGDQIALEVDVKPVDAGTESGLILVHLEYELVE